MQAILRQYNHVSDYERVSQFLVRTYRTTGGHINWLQPRWEYMHYHPLIRGVDLSSIGVWEAHGEIVGVVHPEHGMGTAYFEIDPEYSALKREMLRYAEEHVSTSRDGVRRLRVHINDEDDDFQRVALERGYVRGDGCESMSHFHIPAPFPAAPLPPGFRLACTGSPRVTAASARAAIPR